MKKILIFIIGILILFAGCASKPNTNTNSNPNNTNSSDTLYQQIEKEAICPCSSCLLYTSDAADDLLCVDLGGRRIIKKKNINI